ncbi:MAG: sensor domain-containing diguanylate cyclase [Rhodocyclaceae bacterium]
MDSILDRLSASVVSARSLEELTRPLLELLEAVTGLESTYLTVIDLEKGLQHILYSRNTDKLTIPEGLSVPWGDTLCKRALDSGQTFTNDVSECWGDSEAARALGIQTYLSTPVKLEGGDLYGTLCAASGASHTLDESAQRTLIMFAKLIGQYVEREKLMSDLLEANTRLAEFAATDPLTRLPNRRALQQDLTRMLAHGTRRKTAVLIAFIDLDGFKQINDTHGHDTGDRFLIAVSQRIRGALRTEDLAARIGGDEFVVIGPVPQPDTNMLNASQVFQERIFQATLGSYELDDVRLNYAGASVGVLAVEPGTLDAVQAIKEADAAMYKVKQVRKAMGAGTRVLES